MMTKAIGVIGLGSIGMRHAKNLRDMGHKVIGFDPTWPTIDGVFVYGSTIPSHLATMDGIVIASPSNQHAVEIIETPAHVPIMVEKPIGVCLGDVASLRDEAVARDIRMVGYNLRFHNCVLETAKWLADGMIGVPFAATFVCSQYNDRETYRRDGVILNWSHEIDLALYLLGPASVAGSNTTRVDGQDVTTDILLSHVSGGQSHIHLNYLGDPEQRGFNIMGTGGNIMVNLRDRERVAICERKNGQQIMFDGSGSSFDVEYKTEMQAFIDRIDGKVTPGCTAEEALRVLDVCLAVREQAGLK